MAAASADCSAAAPLIKLDGFPLESVYPQPFYWTEEAAPSAPFRITAAGGCGITISVDYATHGRTADGDDFSSVTDRVEIPTPPDDSPESRDRSVPILHSGSVEPVAEWLDIVLSNASPPVLDAPSAAPMFIVDGDGSSRVAFGLPSYTQSETWPRAVIPVFRAGDASTSHSVDFAVGEGPGNPATPGEDFTGAMAGTLSFAAGDRLETIEVGIVNDKLGEAPEDLTIALKGAGVDAPTSTVLTITDNEENIPPRTRFHHPKHKLKYRKNNLKIREWHVFYSDEGGSGVVAVEVALRRNMTNGKCKWLSKGGWKRGACSDRVWHGTKYDDFVDWYVKRMRQLKPSVKTKIKSYTAFARAIDGAGNVEKDFIKKRNENTFEIKRSRRRR
jgi:hypothetical protein